MLTMVTEVFGVRGKLGKLTIYPKLMKQQFDKTGKASIRFIFADKEFEVRFALVMILCLSGSCFSIFALHGDNLISFISLTAFLAFFSKRAIHVIEVNVKHECIPFSKIAIDIKNEDVFMNKLLIIQPHITLHIFFHKELR